MPDEIPGRSGWYYSIGWIKRSEYFLSGIRSAMGIGDLLTRYCGGRKVFVSPVDETAFMIESQKITNKLTL